MADRDWEQDRNSRGKAYSFCTREHVSLEELKEDSSVDQHYLKRKNIPRYPKPLVFNVSQVCHVTGETGVQGIFSNGGFRLTQDQDQYLWWSLYVTDEDISQAEDDFVDSLDFSWYNPSQQPFLKNFTTSPTFQKKSRYGNFRFTFQLRRLLSLYSRQFCYKTSPVLRVLDTRFYKKEITYSILVHPRHIRKFQSYPRLPFDDPEVCGYSQGSVTWCCQAPSDEYKHRLEVDEEDCEVYATELRGAQYFVWDHVAVAFYMEPNWILSVNHENLKQQVSVCEMCTPSLLREPDRPLSKSQATEILNNLL
ncbi:uncharacterized protein LOC134301197 isoform X1 [Trichomycterus rosablanca]|uniref:uncharacterized protein LOC134301197 isoform X1 n=1 Tax=Trichomycterus rosablanca TaxID=2290929 RepID=UPI002F358259